MKQLAFEAFEPGDLRHGRARQRTARGDHDIGLDGFAHAVRIDLDVPDLARFVETRRGHARVATHVTLYAVFARAVLQIGEDFRLAAERARPCRIRLERKRIEMRGHVAGRAGIGVVAPRAADIAGRLVDRERRDAHSLQTNRHADAGKAAADNRDARRGRRGR